MPCLNRVFEELGVHHRDHEVPAKVLKLDGEKERKAAMKNVTVAAEAKKRKGGGRGKVLSKRRRIGDTSAATSDGSSEEVSESGGDGVLPLEEEVGKMETSIPGGASIVGGDEDLMVSALQCIDGDTTVGAHEVEPLSSMFGGSADSSSSEGNRLEAGATTAPDSEEVASKGGARSPKIPHLEESEAKSEERSPPVHVRDLAPPVRSALVEDAEMVDAAQGIMHLGGLAEAMIGVDVSGDRLVVPGRDLAREGLGRLPKVAGLLGIDGPSETGRTGG